MAIATRSGVLGYRPIDQLQLQVGNGPWRGSAESYVDLHPVGYQDSSVRGVHSGQQVGWAHPGDGYARATIWYGKNTGFTNLTPEAGWRSSAYATNGVQQVGQAGLPGSFEQAAVWAGTASSLQLLSDYLPAGYGYSIALGIGEDGRIVGWAHPLQSNSAHALLWTGARTFGCYRPRLCLCVARVST